MLSIPLNKLPCLGSYLETFGHRSIYTSLLGHLYHHKRSFLFICTVSGIFWSKEHFSQGNFKANLLIHICIDEIILIKVIILQTKIVNTQNMTNLTIVSLVPIVIFITVFLTKTPPFYEVNSFNRKWWAHGGISKKKF